MNYLKYFLVFIIFLGGLAQAQTPSEAVKAYFKVLRQKDFDAAVDFFDPVALGEFRQTMSFVDEIPPQSQQKFFETFFGPGVTKASTSKLSNAEFFSAFFRAVMAQVEAAGNLNFDGMEVLGEVMEEPDIAHVVTRNKVSVGNIEVEAMEVVSLRKNGDSWKTLMSGKMKGIATQLRAAFNRQQ